jgi:hypothetical protein
MSNQENSSEKKQFSSPAETHEESRTTFKEVPNGFQNAEGDGIWVIKTDKGYKLNQIINKKIQEYIATHADIDSPIRSLIMGSNDLRQIKKEMKIMLTDLGFKISEDIDK